MTLPVSNVLEVDSIDKKETETQETSNVYTDICLYKK